MSYNDDLMRTAIHEASHAVAALMLGAPIKYVTVDASKPYFLRGNFLDDRSLQIATEHIVIICMDGPAGEEYFYNGKVPDGGDKLDIAMAREFIARLYPQEIMHGYQLARH